MNYVTDNGQNALAPLRCPWQSCSRTGECSSEVTLWVEARYTKCRGITSRTPFSSSSVLLNEPLGKGTQNAGTQRFRSQPTCTVVVTAGPPWGSQDAGESSSLPFFFAFPVFLHALLQSRCNWRDKKRDVTVHFLCCFPTQKCNSNGRLKYTG